jgi:3-isopropylmalate/(R)-2-methylmalate dehydratase large subunit
MVGGVGALGLRLDTEELAQALVSGRIERRIPEARRVEIRGRLPRYAGAWDVARSIRYRLAGSVHGFVVEVGGDLETWPIGFRASVCGLLVEMGAAAALALPDAAVAEHFRSRGLDVEIPAPSGPGLDKAVLGADEIVATVSRAYADEAIIPGPEPVPIDGVFIGSCYGGHLADLAVAVEILKRGGGVNPEVRLTVSATTLETARGALNAGYYEQFLESGAILAAPGLGAGTAGGGAILGAGERMASTVEYHRADGPEAPDMVIVGPAAAAAAAVTGRLTDPAEFVS